MNHAQKYAASIVDLANAIHGQHVKPAADSYLIALKTLRAINLDVDMPLDHALKAACETFLAVEVLQDAADHAMKAMRAKIASVFEETGCPGVYTDSHHVVPVEGQRGVIITDEAALAVAHPDLMTNPKSAPDRRAIASVLRTKEPVVGAVLANETSPTTIRFSPLKKKVA